MSICPTIYPSLSLLLVLARWVDTSMHYSSVCPFCHCEVELWAEGCKAELQSINKGLTLTTMGYTEMVWWSFHTSNSLGSLVFDALPVKSPEHLLQRRKKNWLLLHRDDKHFGQKYCKYEKHFKNLQNLSCWFWYNTKLSSILLLLLYYLYFYLKTFRLYNNNIIYNIICQNTIINVIV